MSDLTKVPAGVDPVKAIALMCAAEAYNKPNGGAFSVGSEVVNIAQRFESYLRSK